MSRRYCTCSTASGWMRRSSKSRIVFYALTENFVASLCSLILSSCWLTSGPFRVSCQEVVKAPSPIFLKFYSNCHYPIWSTSAKFEWNLSRNGMIITLFSWRYANCSYLAMIKALILPNYISEHPQFFRDASNFAKYWINTIIQIVTFKGQRSCPAKVVCFYLLLQIFENFKRLASKISKFQTPCVSPATPPQLKSFIIMPFFDRFHSKFADVHHMG